MNMKTQRAFTLVEMLLVIVVILVLSGIVVRTAGYVGERSLRARAIAELEGIRHALNEYYTFYGVYPPGDGGSISYEYENTNRTHQAPYFRQWLERHNNPSNPATFFPDARRETFPVSDHVDEWGTLGYRYGMISYLIPRRRGGGQGHWHDADTDQDAQAKERWLPFIADLLDENQDIPALPRVHTMDAGGEMQAIWTNDNVTIMDPWGREYRYECPPPYQRYRLWSEGPTLGAHDDINRDTWNQ